MTSERRLVLEVNNVVGRSALGVIGQDQPLNFKLHAGEAGVVLGGKETSSLFRLVMGLGTIEQGEIRVLGRLALDKDAKPSDVLALRQEIGFGFREKGLISNLSLRDNVDLPAKYHGRYKPGVPAGFFGDQALRELRVERALWDVRPSRISWDVRKKVLLARAIVLSPKVLILDDPSALVASPVIPELLRWVATQKAKEIGILIGTNDYPFGLAVADWVLHPKTHVMVQSYGDFIEPMWISSAELLAGRIKQA